jgi:hypothetical protein
MTVPASGASRLTSSGACAEVGALYLPAARLARLDCVVV